MTQHNGNPPLEAEDNNVILADDWMSVMLPLLDDGHMLKIHPSGTSMIPFITGDRDSAVLRSVSGAALKRGDIVLYRRGNGRHVLHRIHHMEGDSFYMLGDSHTWIEGPVPRESILAVTASFTRKGREISCGSRAYILLSRLWLIIRPARPLVFALRSIFRKKGRRH